MDRGTTDPSIHYKQPSEKHTLTVDYTNRLPDSVTLSMASMTALNLRTRADATSNIVTGTSMTVDADGLTASGQVKNGVAGERFKLTVSALLSNTDVYQDEIILEINEK